MGAGADSWAGLGAAADSGGLGKTFAGRTAPTGIVGIALDMVVDSNRLPQLELRPSIDILP